MGKKKTYPEFGPTPIRKVGLFMSERSQGSRSVPDEQWVVVTSRQLEDGIARHEWQFVTLRNQAGRLSAGLRCIECGLVERVSESQMKGHGRRVERTK